MFSGTSDESPAARTPIGLWVIFNSLKTSHLRLGMGGISVALLPRERKDGNARKLQSPHEMAGAASP
jgi:hypothetical protein